MASDGGSEHPSSYLPRSNGRNDSEAHSRFFSHSCFRSAYDEYRDMGVTVIGSYKAHVIVAGLRMPVVFRLLNSWTEELIELDSSKT